VTLNDVLFNEYVSRAVSSCFVFYNLFGFASSGRPKSKVSWGHKV